MLHDLGHVIPDAGLVFFGPLELQAALNGLPHEGYLVFEGLYFLGSFGIDDFFDVFIVFDPAHLITCSKFLLLNLKQ